MDLTLPVELTTVILTIVLSDCVHQVCFPKSPDADLAWELNALSTLSCVSHDFHDITADICRKIYGPSHRGKSLIRSANARLAFVRQSASVDSMQPIILDEELIKTAFLHSYLMLLFTIHMRKSMRTPMPSALFRHMHPSVLRSAVMVQVISAASGPTELFINLSTISHQQTELINDSLNLVEEIELLKENVEALGSFDPKADITEKGALTAIQDIRHNLAVFKELVRMYNESVSLAVHFTGAEVMPYELPGVMEAMDEAKRIVSPFKSDLAFKDDVIRTLNEITRDWPAQGPSFSAT
ncbi:hypothetical protein GYMLUDRAFT_39467 [Collybiopsis luxurians FD-317 M1]|nr:hypothetical protein GYMLUDRAFT_39467 [Collybiopsis luxurians FD-317 M1]